jgi:phospholipase/lecithinase/hemolysin
LWTYLRGLVAVVAFVIPAPAFPGIFSNIYLLGDSLSDQGNLFIATSALVGPVNALPNPDHYFNGRFSNGPIYADVLAQALGVPLGPSLLGGNNFAFGGARTTYNTVENTVGGPFPAGLFPWSLNAEVTAFKSRNIHDPDALYVVFSGSNDVADILARGLSPAVVIPTAVTGIVNVIQAFKDAGAQTVLVPNVPDLGRIPAFLVSPAASAAATFFSTQFNSALHSALAAISGVDLIEFDTFSLFRSIVDNPGAFGFTNVTTPCYSGFVERNPTATECSNPGESVPWDRVHPTERVHGFLAEALLRSLPVPATLPLVLLGVLVLTGVKLRRRGNRG